MKRNGWVPEGWGYEPPDYSVGIMGEAIFHDDCPAWEVSDSFEATDPVIVETFIGYKGKGFNRAAEIATTWICLDCGEKVSFINIEWDPDQVEELKELVLREVERGDWDYTPRRRWERYCHDSGSMPGDFDVTPEEYERVMKEVFG